MKLTIKTLLQSTFKVDIEPDKSVKELKAKIESEHGKEYPSGAQKLIYSGKILADESLLSEYNIDEKKFIVLMITKPPPAPKTIAPEKPSVKKEEPSKPQKEADKSTPTTQSSTSSSSTTTVTATDTLSSSTIPNLTTPSNTTTTNTTQQPAGGNQRLTTGRSLAANDVLSSMSDTQMATRLAALMSQPHFRQMQDLIQQSPHLISSSIEALAGSDPEMYNFVTENPDLFVRSLNHPPLAGSRTTQQSPRSSAAAGGQQQQAQNRQGEGAAAASTPRNPSGGGGGGGRQGGRPGVDQVLLDVTEHDKEAIERLKELGFSEYLAVQAYMACDKDEQLAANLLFQMDQ